MYDAVVKGFAHGWTFITDNRAQAAEVAAQATDAGYEIVCRDIFVPIRAYHVLRSQDVARFAEIAKKETTP